MDNAGLKLGRVAATIPVSDIERARDFYKQAFGLETVFQNGSPVGFMILKRDAAELHLTLVKGHKGATHNLAHMIVSDAQAAHDRCVEAGARIIKGMKDAEWGLRTFVMADLDGNRIDVGMPLDTE
ncbi:MAG: VOC family protein [Planctomycetes bacterium]|nr:VOC family protein [Planctomycetota bacterium]